MEIDRSRVTPQWLAGFFDGEGCVMSSSRANYFLITVSLSQKDVNILSAVQAIYGGTISDRGANSTAYGHCNVLRWCGKSAKRVLSDMLPYSIVKRDRIELALKAIDKIVGNNHGNPEDRAIECLKIRELNKAVPN